MKHSRIFAAFGIALLGGCGQVADLQPAPGHQLPVKPMMARTTPTPKELLAATPQARPDRVDELTTRNEPRQSDPFNLPPPTGGASPSLPAGSDPQPVSNETGTATPK